MRYLRVDVLNKRRLAKIVGLLAVFDETTLIWLGFGIFCVVIAGWSVVLNLWATISSFFLIEIYENRGQNRAYCRQEDLKFKKDRTQY
jgi:hypothetical protein